MATIWAVMALVMMLAAGLCVLYMALIPDEDVFVPPPTPEPIMEPKIEPLEFQRSFTDEEIEMAAKVVWGEARGIESRMEQAAVVWCLLNRVDKYNESLWRVITKPYQFNYSADYATVDDYGRDLVELVKDVVDRYEREKNGETDVGRVLPKMYLWFGGEDGHNHFRNNYEFNSGTIMWGWTLPDPYTEVADG